MSVLLFSNTEYTIKDYVPLLSKIPRTIILTRCNSKEFYEVLYILGIPTIYLKEMTDTLYDVKIESVTDLENYIKNIYSSKHTDYYVEMIKLVTICCNKHIEYFIREDNEIPDKFQTSMQKEAGKLKFANDKEKYRQIMHKSSLSNRKSIDKSIGKKVQKPINKIIEEPVEKKAQKPPKPQVPPNKSKK